MVTVGEEIEHAPARVIGPTMDGSNNYGWTRISLPTVDDKN